MTDYCLHKSPVAGCVCVDSVLLYILGALIDFEIRVLNCLDVLLRCFNSFILNHFLNVFVLRLHEHDDTVDGQTYDLAYCRLNEEMHI
jgi:hypothetical protein